MAYDHDVHDALIMTFRVNTMSQRVFLGQSA
jgi:hypothetical protein